jgi:hypothetical protein
VQVIIAGSRIITEYDVVVRAIEESGFFITELVSGGARGVDRLGERWARGHHIPIKLFLPDWDRHGTRGPFHAGIVRNRQMATYVGKEGGLIAVWDGTSPGTKNMVMEARDRGLKVSVMNLRKERKREATHTR